MANRLLNRGLYLLALLVVPTAVAAQDSQQVARAIPPANTLYPLPAVEGVARWEVLTGVEMAYSGDAFVAEFSDEVEALHGTEVKLVGFLMPLDTAGDRMLLSMISPNCPFCLPGGPGTMIEIESDERLEWTEEAVVVTGHFEIIGRDWTSLFYRLSNIKSVTVVPPG